MKHATIFLFLLFSVMLSAQDTIPMTTSYKDGKKNEVYSVNKAGNKVGKYVRYTRYGKVYVEGQYSNGIPVGTWKYYAADTSGILVQTLDFDRHKETFVDSVHVPSLVCGPRYFGGNTAKQEYVQLRIKNDFTEQERAQLKGKAIMAVFEVDPKTLTTYGASIQDNSLSQDVRTKMEKAITEMPAWLPPVCTGGTPVWRMSVVFVF